MPFLKDRFTLLTLLTLSLSFAAGCETLGLGDNDDNDSDPIDRPDDTIGRTDSDVRPPARAEVISTGFNDTLNYRADRDGTIYVMDETDNRVVLTREIQAGDRFFFDPRDGRGEINGRSLSRTELDKLDTGHDFKVYFAREKGRAANRDDDNRRLDDGDNVDAVR